MLREDCYKSNHSIVGEWEGNEITFCEKKFINAETEGEWVENRRGYELIPSLGLAWSFQKIIYSLKKKITVPHRYSEYTIFLNLQKIVKFYKETLLESLALPSFHPGAILGCAVPSWVMFGSSHTLLWHQRFQVSVSLSGLRFWIFKI